MTDYELALVATLQAEAEEAAMQTSAPEQYELLESRMDDVDQGRRRWQAVGGLAVAAVVVLVAFLAAGRPSASAPPATAPTPKVSAPAPTAVRTDSGPSIKGVWNATLTETDARRTLAAAGLAGKATAILREVCGFHGSAGKAPTATTCTLQLYVNSVWGYLYVLDEDGAAVMVDQFSYELEDGPTLATTTGVGAGEAEFADYSLFLQAHDMRLGWLSGRATGGAEVNEAAKRALYTSVTWTR